MSTGASVSGSTTWLGAGTVIRLAFSITCATASAAAVKKATSDIVAACSALVMSSTGWLIEDSQVRGGDPSFRHAASYASVWAIGNRGVQYGDDFASAIAYCGNPATPMKSSIARSRSSSARASRNCAT